MFIRVSAIFGANFDSKKAPRSSCLVLGYTNPRHHWVQNRHSCNTPSRLKGIETWTTIIISRPLDSCNTPSRLKGIETLSFTRAQSATATPCNTPSRLKGIETLYPCLDQGRQVLHPCNTPSRLKGIETWETFLRLISLCPSLQYTFPFEGNWNKKPPPLTKKVW